MDKLTQIYLHTGSNLGDRGAHLKKAVELIEEKIGVVEKASQVYRTKAWGLADQPDFLNQALEVKTSLSPLNLLDQVLAIEDQMGRKRVKKWGQRLIDIDILFYGDQVFKLDRLTIPHPYLHHRNFVLIPLLEIAPEFIHPAFKLSIAELGARSEDSLDVEQIDL